MRLGLHGPGQVHRRQGHDAATLHAHEHRAILGAQGREQHATVAAFEITDDDLLARASWPRCGEPATVAREHGDFHPAGADRAQGPRCEGRDIDTQPARAAGGTRQLAVSGALPAVARQSSGRRRSGGGVAAVVEGHRLLRVRAPHQRTQRQGRERHAALHAAPRCGTCISASTSASTRIGLEM